MAAALAAHYTRSGAPLVAAWLEGEARSLGADGRLGEERPLLPATAAAGSRATWVSLPDLSAIEAALLRDGDADEFSRIDHWFGAVSRGLRAAGVSLFAPAWPRPWDIVLHPTDAAQLRRWMLADVRERHAGHPLLEVMADTVWHLVGPHTDPGIRPGILVHHLRRPAVSPSCTEAPARRSPA